MNKRLQKLAESTDRACEHLGRSDIGEEWLEKFAELIVQECVAEAEDDCAGWAERDQCLVMQVMERIKQHFGVDK
jgi:hypothetical protein